MCKFGFNFSQLYFSEIILGKSGLNQNSHRYNKLYFFKSNLTHKLQSCL